MAVACAGLCAARASAQTQVSIAHAKRDLDGDFYPDDAGLEYVVQGQITTPNLAAGFPMFYIEDPADGTGILVRNVQHEAPIFGPSDIGKTVRVRGVIRQVDGVRSIEPVFEAWVTVVDAGATPVEGRVREASDLLAEPESYEGSLVVVSNLFLSGGGWPGWSDGWRVVRMTNQAGVALDAFVGAGTDMPGQFAPTGPFALRGIFSQYDPSSTPSAGYQMVPRFYADVLSGGPPAAPDLLLSVAGPLTATPGAALTIDVLARDPNPSDALSLRAAQAPTGANFTDHGNRRGRFTWTPGATDQGRTRRVVFEVTDGLHTSSAAVDIQVLPLDVANVVLNEFLFDPSNAGLRGDANGDGVASATADEFVEIYNRNSTPMDIAGWTLYVGTNRLFAFPAGSVVSGRCAAVVFGGGNPTGFFGRAQIHVAGAWPGLRNTGDQGPIRLVTSRGLEAFSYDYAPGGNINESLTRSPDTTGAFVPHGSVNAVRPFSPGTRLDGAAFAGAGVTNNPPFLATVDDAFVRVGEEARIRIAASDPDGTAPLLSVTNGPEAAWFTDRGNGAGDLVYRAPAADAGRTFGVTVRASDGAWTVVRRFTLRVVEAEYSGLVINEYLPDPSGLAAGVDANGDGRVSDADEFVEILNDTDRAIALRGVSLRVDGRLRHTFVDRMLPAGGTVVVFAGGRLDDFAFPPAERTVDGRLSLDDESGAIELGSPAGRPIDRVDYSAAPSAAAWARWPDGAAAWANHHQMWGFGDGLRASPGRRNVSGGPFLTNQPPFLSPIADMCAPLGARIEIALRAVDPADGDPIRLSASNAPPGATLAEGEYGRATFIWTNASPAGAYTNVFRATDKDGAAVQRAVLTVANPGLLRTAFISELCDPRVGFQTNRYIEIYNPLEEPVDLNGWRVVAVANDAEGQVWDLAGSIGPGQAWVCGRTGNTSAHAVVAWSLSTWNGGAGDGAELWNGDRLIDTVVCARDGSFADASLVRAPTVWMGRSIREEREWFRTPVPGGIGSGGSTPGRHVCEYPWGTASNRPPRLSPIGARHAVMPDGIEFAIRAWDPVDSDIIRLSVSNAPAGSTLTDSGDGTGRFAWPGAGPAGVYTVRVYASDKDGSSSLAVVITVHPAGSYPFSPWINEIHYDNAGADLAEGVEIAGVAGQDLAGYTLTFYNGDDRRAYLTRALNGLIDDEGDGFGALWFAVPGMQNGPADGVALTGGGNPPLFLSYGGSLTAEDGPVAGRTSVDVGVAEPGAAGTSLQLQGSGTNYSGFVWVGPTNASAGTLNAGQTARATDPVQDHDRDGLPSAWELRYFGGITNAQCGCDPDGDGADNRAEWWAGTDPTNPASVLRMHGFAAGSHGIVLRWPSVSGRLYRVLSGPRPGHALMPLTNVAATAPVNVFTVRVDSAASGGFYRVGAGKPPE